MLIIFKRTSALIVTSGIRQFHCIHDHAYIHPVIIPCTGQLAPYFTTCKHALSQIQRFFDYQGELLTAKSDHTGEKGLI